MSCLLTMVVSPKLPSGSIVVDRRETKPIIEMIILGINILSSILEFLFFLFKNSCTFLNYFFFLIKAGTSRGSLLSTSKFNDELSSLVESLSSDISNSRPLDRFSFLATLSSS